MSELITAGVNRCWTDHLRLSRDNRFPYHIRSRLHHDGQPPAMMYAFKFRNLSFTLGSGFPPEHLHRSRKIFRYQRNPVTHRTACIEVERAVGWPDSNSNPNHFSPRFTRFGFLSREWKLKTLRRRTFINLFTYLLGRW